MFENKNYKTNNILGFEIFSGNISELSENLRCELETQTQKTTCVSCLNPHSYVISKYDASFMESLRCTDLILPDGVGILFGGWLLGKNFPERITGMDFFLETMRILDESSVRSKRVFFLGATLNTLTKIEKKVYQEFNNIEEVGFFEPPFKAEFNKLDVLEMANAINNFSPDALWIGITAPKQEKLCLQLREYVDPKIIGNVGAVFDFYAGTVKRSSPFFRKNGLEWLPRLLKQPLKLWRRVFISTPIFLFHIIKFKLKRNSEGQ